MSLAERVGRKRAPATVLLLSAGVALGPVDVLIRVIQRASSYFVDPYATRLLTEHLALVGKNSATRRPCLAPERLAILPAT